MRASSRAARASSRCVIVVVVAPTSHARARRRRYAALSHRCAAAAPVRVRLRSPPRHRAHHRASLACHRAPSRASSRCVIVVVVTPTSHTRPGSSHCLVVARGAEHGRGDVPHAAGARLGWRVSRTAHPSAPRLRAARTARTTRRRLLRIMSDCFLRIMDLVTGKIKSLVKFCLFVFSLDATSLVSPRRGRKCAQNPRARHGF